MPTSSWIDVSMPLLTDMPRAFAYSAPSFAPHLVGTQPNGEPVTATRIDMFSHVGTHIESARHIFGQGKILADYAIDRFTGRGYVVDLGGSAGRCIDADEIAAALPSSFETDAFLLLHLRGEDADNARPHSYLSEAAAQWLVKREVRAVGVDTSSPDMDVKQRSHPLDLPVHRTLLGAGMLIIENLGLGLKQACGSEPIVHAWPLNIAGSDSSPVRVVLQLN